MIEWRAILSKNKKFKDGFKLERGTFVYVRPTPNGWMGMYYTDKGSAHSFELDDLDFSILQSADCQVEEMVAMPDPPQPSEERQRETELVRRRMMHQIKRHREAADEIERLLSEGP